MNTLSHFNLKQWVKEKEHPVARYMHSAYLATKAFEVPLPKKVACTLFYVYKFSRAAIELMTRILLFTPMFKGKASQCGKNLYLYGGLPHISGPLEIKLGNNCRISGRTTFSGRYSKTHKPQLLIGNNVDIGWQSTLAIGRKIRISDNVRIAGGCFMGGYPGHPIDPQQRALGASDTDEQAKDIILEKDVWLGTGVTIIGGVTIGEATIVAAGSVVTKSLPANVLAGGNPAKVIRHLNTIGRRAA